MSHQHNTRIKKLGTQLVEPTGSFNRVLDEYTGFYSTATQRIYETKQEAVESSFAVSNLPVVVVKEIYAKGQWLKTEYTGYSNG